MKIDKIYIIHYYKEVERREYIKNILPSLNIPFEFRSIYNRESEEIYSNIYFEDTDENKHKRNTVFNKHELHIDTGMPLCWGEKAKGYRAVTLEHFKTYEYILNNTTYNNVLILEDDVILENEFKNELEKYKTILEEGYDICYLGSGCGLTLPYYTEKLIDINYNYQSKCSDSYIITRNAIQKIYETALPFYCAIDWELTYLAAINDLKVLWVTDPKIHQGSQTGKYNSTLLT